jgi:OFA family oxalate/formate antiporter-like MFS transporter
LVKWFPDRRGLITGIAVAGFGAGALVTAPVATYLIQSVGVLQTFAYLGVAYLVVTMATGFFMQNPPDGWKPAGWAPSTTQTRQRALKDYTLAGALRTWQWWALWALLFLNASAGISLISQESPIFQELSKASAIAAASMVGIASIGNAVGRIFWASISDVITRRWTFTAMYVIQVFLFWFLPVTSSVFALTVLSFIILMCYGPYLWPDDDLMGLCECIRLAALRATPPDQRIVCQRPPLDSRHHGSVGVVAHSCFAAESAEPLIRFPGS